ncbi:MAG: PcfB family protein [Coriobacteriales bacterium]|jgi:hypothetical protein|nr:PcfB family protein [Coriobacteriales bacterium]
MDATEQAIDQTMRITLMGVEYALRFSGAGAKNLASAVWSVATTQQKTKGKARLVSLLKSGKELKVFGIAQAELKDFAKEARRYGVLYAVIKGIGESPDGHVDVMVKAEDAAKINRIVEKLEFGRFDETQVVVEAQRELDTAAKDGDGKAATERSVAQGDANTLLDELLGQEQSQEGAPPKNPTEARAGVPSPSEPSSRAGGNRQKEASSERQAHQQERANKRHGLWRDMGIIGEDGRERQSVRRRIEDKRHERAERRQDTGQPTRAAQTRHQTPKPTRRRGYKSKTEKGR